MMLKIKFVNWIDLFFN